MEIGIVGLPYSGKTTLFSTLTGLEMKTSHATGKLEPHHGMVRVPDQRLDRLTEIFHPRKQVNATIEYIDVAGMDTQNIHGKGFDPQFLAILKNTDALCLVVQAFSEELIPHPAGSIDPLRDIKIIESEFLLTDLGIVEKRLERLNRQIMLTKSESDIRERELMRRFLEALEQEKPLRELELSHEERVKIRGFQFLSAKPLLIVINYGESDIPSEKVVIAPVIKEYQSRSNVTVTGLCAKVEYEISQLEEDDRRMFLQEMKIDQQALFKMIQQSYGLLGLISFFTFGDDECRAWTISRGTHAQQAAGVIHTDLERGFIRAEVVHFSDFTKIGSIAKCREQGILRLEGKDYIVRDGDMITIRFNI